MLVLDAATGLAGGELATAELAALAAGTAGALDTGAPAAGVAAAVVGGVDVAAIVLTPAELLLLLHPLMPSTVPTRQAHAKAKRGVGRERLVMVIPLFGRRRRAVHRTASHRPVTAG